MIDSWVGLFIVGLLGYITYKFYIYPWYVSPTSKIPGPPADHFLLGNFLKLINEEPTEPQFEWAKKYGGIVCYHSIANRVLISITDPKLMQQIMVNEVYSFLKPEWIFRDLRSILGDGILTSEGDIHRRQRKMMNPAFAFANIKVMVPTIVRVVKQAKKIWEDQIGDKKEERLEISKFISKVTLDVIGLVGFNYEFKNTTSHNELATAYDKILNQNRTKLNKIVSALVTYIPGIRKIPLPRNIELRDSIKVIERVSLKLVKEGQSLVREGKPIGKDLLSLLISANENLPNEEKMSDVELQYQIMTFLAAGHETTSSATSWSLYLLAQHPEIQERLRKELVEAFPDPNCEPTFEKVKSLEYLNCVIKESMRVIPPVPIIVRAPIKDTILQGYLIPKDTVTVIPIAAVHKLPSIWGSDAEKFIPERWQDPKLMSEINNSTYTPFATGPRRCIGNKLALLEIKILLSILIRNFEFKEIEGFSVEKVLTIVTRPSPSIELLVSKARL